MRPTVGSVGSVASAGLYVERHHPDAVGPPVVLVHGAPDRSRNFARVIAELPDVPIVAYDRRGYGNSVMARNEREGFHAHAEDLIEMLGGTPSIVVAQSAGGAVGMVAATLAPELFLALGMWEPPMVPWRWWGSEARWRMMSAWALFPDAELLGENVAKGIVGADRWERLRPETQAMLRAEGAAFRADMTHQLRPYFDVDQVKVPALVGHGVTRDDGNGGVSHARLAERIGAELVSYTDADHYAHTGNPRVWADFVRRTIALAERTAVPEAMTP